MRFVASLAAVLLVPACGSESPLPRGGGTLTLSGPSVLSATAGPVTYTLTYDNVADVTLTAADVELLATGTATGNVAVSATGPRERTVTLDPLGGVGTLAISVREGSALDNFGLPIASAGPSAAFDVDTQGPSLTLSAPSVTLTRGDPVSYTVAYSDADTITLSAADVALTTTGSASGSVAVSGSGSTRILTISSVSGDGTIRVGLAAGTATDLAGNAAPALAPAGVFTVDTTVPELSISAPSASLVRGGPVTYTLTYAGADVITLGTAHLALNVTGTANADVSVSGSGSSRTVTLSGITGDGGLGISVAAGSAFDVAGNGAAAGGPSTTFSVDNTPPAASVSAPSVGMTSGGPVSYTVGYTGATSVSLDAADVALHATGTATGSVSVNGLEVTVSGISGYGTLAIRLLEGTAHDLAGNPAPATGPSASFSVDDGVSPAVTGVSPTEVDVSDVITVTGIRFGATQGSSLLTISGAPAAVTSWSDTQIQAIVPASARTGPVVVELDALDSTAGFLIVRWTVKNPVNRAICVAANDQLRPEVVPDGAGGAIIVWHDQRLPGNNDVYAQRVDSAGVPLWAANGIPVCALPDHQSRPRAVSDGAGGAIVVWEDSRGSDLYAQRIDGSGAKLWAPDGVNVCDDSGSQSLSHAAPDGQGGILLTWIYVGGGFGTGNDVWAQRVSPAGVPLWGSKGVVAAANAGNEWDPRIVAGGGGAAYVTWTTGTDDVRAQRISGAGAIQWSIQGAVVCAADDRQVFPRPVAQGIDGLIVVWQDYRADGFNPDVYGQRLDPAGTAQWALNGIVVAAAAGYQGMPEAVPDGAGGATAAWQDTRSGSGTHLYAQRIDGAGTPLWTPNGVPVCVAAGTQSIRLLQVEGGGLIAAWTDSRGFQNIYAQKLDGTGAPLWTLNGVPVTEAWAHQENPSIAPDGYGGVIVAWDDSRTSSKDIYAQGLSPSGQ